MRHGLLVGLLAALVGACRSDGPPPALQTAAEAPAQPGEATPAEPVEAKPSQPDRELWFPSGPGREAILARERHDYGAALAHLDVLLARADLSPNDRAAAQWLRGLEDLRQERYAAAADRFAEARANPALAAAALRLVVLEAQARLDGSDPSAALTLVTGVAAARRKGSPLDDDLLVIEADARSRSRDPAGARKAYKAYLARYPSGARRFEVRAKLARVLAASEDRGDHKRAAALYEALLLETPLSDYGEEAAAALPELRKTAGLPRSGAKATEFQRKVQMARIDAMLERRRYRETIVAADRMLKGPRRDPGTRCRILYAKGTAIFKRRKRKDAQPVFTAAGKACKASGDVGRDLEVRSRYQAARGLYAAGRYKKAAAAFEALAKQRKDHSYADDAWVLAAESWTEQGTPKRAKAALRAALKVPGGDMHPEARRRLLLHAFSEGDDAGALKLCDAALKAGARGAERAKLQYFRGRALARLGRTDEARAAWVAALREQPLDYIGLQALSRLRDAGADGLKEGLAVLASAGAASPREPLPDSDEAKRALLLARLGLGQEAREELRAGKVDGWPAVAVLNQAGLFAEGQKLVANLGTAWRRQVPSPANRERWALAYPRPFAEVVGARETTHQVPTLLVYAIMQTESRFDPGVTSWAGARGLTQLMPSTASAVAKDAGVELGEDSLHDPVLNLDLGMRHLGSLVRRFGGGDGAAALAVPSYNAGAGSVERWLDQRGGWDLDLFVEAIPYDETRKYTQRVLGRWMAYRWLYSTDADAQNRVPYLPLKIVR